MNDYLVILWRLPWSTQMSKAPDEIYSRGDEQVKVGKMIGQGATSCVYECSYRSEEGTVEAVAKFLKDEISYVLETLAYAVLQGSGACLQLLATFGEQRMLIVEKGVPVLSTIDNVESHRLTKNHMKQLFEHLRFIHSKGYVHRDTRLANIVLLDGGSRAVFCDLGSMAPITSNFFYNGAEETASQSVLSQKLLSLSNGQQAFYPNFTVLDDLEGFFKTFLVWARGLAPALSKIKTFSEFFEFWESELFFVFQDRVPKNEQEWLEAFELFLGKSLDCWNPVDETKDLKITAHDDLAEEDSDESDEDPSAKSAFEGNDEKWPLDEIMPSATMTDSESHLETKSPHKSPAKKKMRQDMVI